MTGFNRACPDGQYAQRGYADSKILALWNAGRDTLDIARALNLPESAIANRLLHIRDRALRDQEWDFDRGRS